MINSIPRRPGREFQETTMPEPEKNDSEQPIELPIVEVPPVKPEDDELVAPKDVDIKLGDQIGKTAREVDADEFARAKAGKKVRVIKKSDIVALVLSLLEKHGAKNNTELLAQLAEAEIKLAQGDQSLQLMRDQILALQQELAEARARIEAFDQELKARESARDAAEARSAKLEDELARLQGEYSALQRVVSADPNLARIEKLEKLIEALLTRISEMELGLDFFELTQPVDEARVDAALEAAGKKMDAAQSAASRAGASPEGERARAVLAALREAAASAKKHREAWKGLVAAMDENRGAVGVVVEAVKARQAIDYAMDKLDLAGKVLN
jgi:chromosome segregation ATPase